MFEESLAIRKKMLGEEHPDVAQSLNNLAALYENQGKYDEAEKMFEESLAIRKKMLGEEHPDVAKVSTILLHCTKTKASTTRRRRCSRSHSRYVKRC